jgi:uncharacterized membrane protein
MKHGFPQLLRTTLVGGVIFLLPLLLVVFIIQQGYRLTLQLAKPLAQLLPDKIVSQVEAPALVAALALLIVTFAAGLFAQTRMGKRTIRWVQNSLIGTLPQFSFARGIAESIDGDYRDVEVVLVPTDAGLCFGFIFNASSEPWIPVFIPGAPEWTSGSLAFVQTEAIRQTNVTFLDAVMILKGLGEDANKVTAGLKAYND